MEAFIKDLNNIFKKFVSYEVINKNNNKNLRNSKISLHDIIYYQFKYSSINITKNAIISEINLNNNKCIHNSCFLKKQNNISLKWFELLLFKISNLCDEYILKNNNSKNKTKIVAIDGTYSNNHKQKPMLNLGIYDVTNKIPINLVFKDARNRNKEILSATKFIKNNVSLFKNSIILFDRGYFSYDFINFLNKNNIKFVIRCKSNTKIRNMPNIQYFEFVSKITKTINLKSKKDKQYTKVKCEIDNNYKFISNIDDVSKETISELYKYRWDIETYFKFIKNNFKIQHTKENKSINVKKIFICSLILTKIMKIINHITKNKKINNTHFMTGMSERLFLEKMIKGNLDIAFMDKFNKNYIKKDYNKQNRHFPRISNIPFSKWYVKKFSVDAEINKILEAIMCNKVNDLDKNKKLKASKIKIIKQEIINR